MIFIFLGFLFLVFWSFAQARKKLNETFLKIQKIWAEGDGGSFFYRFLLCIGFVVLSASPHQSRLTSVALLGRKQWNTRWALVLICLSSFAVLFWAGILSLTFQWPGGFFMLAGFLALLLPKKWSSLISFLGFIFFLGLFLHSIENALRMSTFLNQDPSLQDFYFLLSDNRLFSVLSWLLVSALITLFLPFEGWAWIFSILGLSMGVMGLNVAVGFVVGESLGAGLVFWRVIRKSAPDFKNLALEYFLINLLTAVIFLFAYGLLKSEFYDLSSLSSGPLPERIAYFLICALAWSGGATLIALVWGHFKALTAHKGTISAESVAQWQENGGILPTFVQDLFSLSQKPKDQ